MPRRPALSVPPARALAEAAAAEAKPSTERYAVHAELGPEVDTNAHRTETFHVAGIVNEAPVVSALGRAVLSGSISDVLRADQQVALSATVAAKVFENQNARTEDVAILDAGAQWRKPLDERWGVGLSGSYYEAFQPNAPLASSDRRDFRSFTPALRLTRTFGDSIVGALGGGYRLFVYKPDHSFDFQAPMALLETRWARETADGAADWELSLRGSYEHRAFGGRQLQDAQNMCMTAPNCPPTTGTEMRVDHYVTGVLDLARTGRVLLGGGYGASFNDSNSYGETVLRHFLTARFAAALPLDFYFAARIEVVFARYSDKVYLAAITTPDAGRPYSTIEDENRNSARAELSRNLGDRLQLVARYTFYANELKSHSDVTYRRQTALLFLSYALEN